MLKQYLHNPELPFIRSDWEGNLVINRQFQYSPPLPEKTFRDVLKWKTGGNPQKVEKETDKFRPDLIRDEKMFETREDGIVWMGHASFFIRINGLNILTDPVYFDLYFLKRRVGIPCGVEKIKNLDILLLSHDHRDHCDISTLKVIFKNNPKVKVLAPLQMKSLIHSINPAITVIEMGWYQQIKTEKDLTITYLPAKHWCRRYLHDYNRILWGSFMIQSPAKTVYFAGDTAYDGHFQEISTLFPKIEVVLMPVGAYKPYEMMKDAHINPEDAVKAFHELNASHFFPMHYGTFDLSDEPAGEPVRWLEKTDMKGELHIPGVGEKFYW